MAKRLVHIFHWFAQIVQSRSGLEDLYQYLKDLYKLPRKEGA